MNLKTVEPYIIYKVIAGSKAYNLDLPTSDTDIRGVFILENWKLLSNNYHEQVGDKKSDIVFYEFNRFMDLLSGANPNILENLFVPQRCILHKDPVFDILYDNRELFLTKKIKYTFGGYAISQIKKARGLNKKIVNPIPKERKTPLDFCYIIRKDDGYMFIAKDYFNIHTIKEKQIGLAEMPNGPQLFKAYADVDGGYRGICSIDSDDLRHSEIPKGEIPFGFLWYNKDGYSTYCKEYKQYWEWADNRNPHRYNDNVANKHNYDGKNMMHCLRMLDMAIEVAKGEGMILERPNREFLLSVRKGEESYDDILEMIEEKKIQMDQAFDNSKLPEKLDRKLVTEIIRKTRNI